MNPDDIYEEEAVCYACEVEGQEKACLAHAYRAKLKERLEYTGELEQRVKELGKWRDQLDEENSILSNENDGLSRAIDKPEKLLTRLEELVAKVAEHSGAISYIRDLEAELELAQRSLDEDNTAPALSWSETVAIVENLNQVVERLEEDLKSTTARAEIAEADLNYYHVILAEARKQLEEKTRMLETTQQKYVTLADEKLALKKEANLQLLTPYSYVKAEEARADDWRLTAYVATVAVTAVTAAALFGWI